MSDEMNGKDCPIGDAMDFQEATAWHIFKLLTDESHPHRRVLLADEVGLGKTIVARKVVSLIREYQRVVKNAHYYRVVYVCSNINIASQNISKLGIKTQMDPNSSRLSMQHLSISRNKAEAVAYRLRTGKMPEIIIPLTPSTSFDFRSHEGIAPERAVICVILETLDEFADDASHKYLERFFQCGIVRRDNWQYYLDRYRKETTSLGDAYMSEMREGLRTLGADAVLQLKAYAMDKARPEWSEKSKLISAFRRVFAEISLSKLEPDLVIMDEFQRFKSLLADDNEQSLLARKFFADPNTKVLLLSATPYKPFTTLDELTESGTDEHFFDFRQVMGFLQEGDTERKEIFDDAWKRYSVALTHISGETFDVVKAAKVGAENALYSMMCRTERFNVGSIKTVRVPLEVSAEDVKSYFEARMLLDELNGVTAGGGYRTMPLDYVKSCPYLMSFMDRYKLKGFVKDNRGRLRRKAWDLLYLPLKKVDGYRPVPPANARLQYLLDSLFAGGHSAEKLLWVPASRPYYRTDGVFAKNAGFSKTLVFSSWEMVPRMISCMVSYEAERRVIKGLWTFGRRPGNYFKGEERTNKNRYAANRLGRFKDGDNPICHVCRYLADLYIPSEHLGEDVNEIKKVLIPAVRERVEGIKKTYGIPVKERAAMADLTLLMKLLDGEVPEHLPEYIDEDAVKNLVMAAIGSPAICAFRMSRNLVLSESIGRFFEEMFNRADPAMIVDLSCARDKNNYIEEILEYCVEGNLQAVLDEYDHMLDGKWDDILTQGPMGVGNLTVEMQDVDYGITSRAMRTWMAIPFTNARMEDKAVARTSVIRSAFNSPFRPFVLCTTSVGQEGLDFHWYARHLLHWNLPSNPVDMEQREGRVNRYKCHSIRQRLGERYPNKPTWDEIFSAARDEYKRGDSDIVPYWCLPPDFPEGKDLMVERIILEYPLSQDHVRYDRLKKVLSLYRLTMGQPRQEELLEMLSTSGLSEEQINQLMINLCPYSRDGHHE